MNNTLKKICFIIPTLSAGGAERIMLNIYKNLSDSNFECSMIVIGREAEAAYNIDGLNVIFLNKKRVLISIPTLLVLLFKMKPDIIIGSITHLNSILGYLKFLLPKIIFIGRQSNISIMHNNANSKTKSNFRGALIKIGLKKLDYVICQSSDMRTDCIQNLKIIPDKIIVINNPITDGFNLNQSEEKTFAGIIHFVTVGRLVKIKGHKRILNVLSKYQKDFIYTIIGTGPENENLIEEATTLGIIDKIKFVEFTSEVAGYLTKSHFYLQGSYSEGFPNALLESCAVGTPVIAFDAPGGTREIIENGVNGYIVANENEFLKCLDDYNLFHPRQVSSSVFNKFSKEVIMKKYEKFLLSISDQ